MRELSSGTAAMPGRPVSTGANIENREKVTLTGIVSVDAFDEKEINARCGNCCVTVSGQNLHVSRLDLDAGVLVVNGFIRGLEYTAPEGEGGFLSRLFR